MKSEYTEVGGKAIFPSRFFFAFLCVVFLGSFIFTKISRSKQAHDAEIIAENGSHPAFTPKGFINLDNFYNADPKTNWLDGEIQDRSLADLPAGVNVFNGATFRVGGLVQLQGTNLKEKTPLYPDSISAIPVQMTCSNLHFFHGAAWSVADGLQIGTYVIHFADKTQLQMPIVYGKDVRNWSFNSEDPDQVAGTAWSSKKHAISFRLYASTWQNPKPDVPVTSIDFVSSKTDCAPFLLAITAE